MSYAMLILERCLTAENEIAEMKKRYAWQLEAATAADQALEPAGDRHATGTPGDAFAGAACELAAQQDEITERERRRSAEVIGVTKMLKRLSLLHAQLIQLCYVKRLPMGAVAAKMGYGYGYVRQVKMDALAKVAEIPDAEAAALMPPWYPLSLTPQELEAQKNEQQLTVTNSD